MQTEGNILRMSSRQPGAELAWLLQCLAWGDRANRCCVILTGRALGKVHVLTLGDTKLHASTPPAGCKLVSRASKNIHKTHGTKKSAG